MIRELKPLKQENFDAIIIKDLGLIEYGSQGKTSRYGVFRCKKCGTEKKLRVTDVKKKWENGLCRECRISSKNRKFNNKRLRRIWKAMQKRCNDTSSKYYGNKGITIKFEDYFDFEKWSLENGYSDNLSIDRIDGNGNYSKQNCRWTTANVQARNTELLYSTNKSGFRGVCFAKDTGKFQSQIKVDKKSIYLGQFETAEEAARAYDNFVINNNLEHTINNI